MGYVSRVLIKQDSDTDDYLWKRSVEVLPPSATSVLTQNINNDSVYSAFLAEPDITHLDSYLERGNTLALLIMKNGEIIYEWYGRGHSREQPAAAFSISKTVIALLVARAIDDGQLKNLSVPATQHVPEFASVDPRFNQVTLGNLINMRSGIGFSEKVSFPWINKDAPAVYYASDLAATVKRRAKIVSPPGSFLYNDYAPNIVGLILENATGQSLASGPLQALWNDLNAEYPVVWSVDHKGFAWHESGLVITARDLLRIGKLMLDGGTVGSRQVAPIPWLNRSLASDPRGAVVSFGNVDAGYRSGWWTADHYTNRDDIFTMGRHGQVMLISPANQTIVVRLGHDGNPESNISIASRFRRVADRLSKIESE